MPILKREKYSPTILSCNHTLPSHTLSFHSNEWNVFRSKGIHLIHLNVNILLLKIDEIRYIAACTKAAVIGITESKFDEFIFQSEIEIDNYDLLRCDRNKNGRGVASYIRSDISYVKKDFFPNVIENILFEILLPKITPTTVGIMYRPPSQTNFLEILNMTFEKVDIDKKEIYILGDSNINMYLNSRYIVSDDNTISSKFPSHGVKNYHQFCTMHSLKQLIQSPTRVTCSTLTLTDHILTSAPSRVSQKGAIIVGVSDHQLIFCTRKISRIKTGGAHKYLNYRSLKNYTADYYKEALKQIDFPNYVNDMPQAVTSTLVLYAYGSCILYQHKDVVQIEKRLSEDSENLCDWFVDNKLSLHFGEDKAKSILFAIKRRAKNIRQLNLKYKDTNIKQRSEVTYLGCVLDETMSGEPIALKVINNINGKLKFLYRKNRFLSPELRRMLCSALIQPHFDYACPVWHPNLTEKTKKKIQIMQNKCIRFCLRLDKMDHITDEDFRLLNWLPTSKRVDQCINTITFKFVNNTCPYYLKEIF